jgi:uncharacterized ferritin-like protein (DUF455 family)
MPLPDILFQLITTSSFDEKIHLGQSLAAHAAETLAPLDSDKLQTLKSPGRPAHFSIVPPRKVPKRNMADLQSRIHFLHAIANIELLAIELPALCLLRFGCADSHLVADELKIISEEANHFDLLRARLKDFGCDFGTVAVHHGLWDYAWQCDSELEHQILIPCYLEARGLDVTPEFVQKFKDLGDEKTASIMQLILTEEIRHVRHGIHYLEKTATALGTTKEDVFEKTLKKFFGDKLKSKVPLNKTYRAEAGFSEEQMRILS